MRRLKDSAKSVLLLIAIASLNQLVAAGKGKGDKGKGNMVIMMGSGGGGGGQAQYGGGGYPMPIPMPICSGGFSHGGAKKKGGNEKIVIIPVPATMMSGYQMPTSAGNSYGMGSSSYSGPSNGYQSHPMQMQYGMMPTGGGNYASASQEYSDELPLYLTEEGEQFAGSNNRPATVTSDGMQLNNNDQQSEQEQEQNPSKQIVQVQPMATGAPFGLNRLEAHYQLPPDKRRR